MSAVMHGTCRVERLIVRADIDASALIPTKVAAREGAVIALAGVADRNMGPILQPTSQPRKRPVPYAVSAASRFGFSRKPLRFERAWLLSIQLVARRMSLTTFSAGSFAKLECCLIFAPVNATMSQKHSLLNLPNLSDEC